MPKLTTQAPSTFNELMQGQKVVEISGKVDLDNGQWKRVANKEANIKEILRDPFMFRTGTVTDNDNFDTNYENQTLVDLRLATHEDTAVTFQHYPRGAPPLITH